MDAYETIARQFFDTYTRGLLDRDARVIASHYAVPALIVFPGQAIVVSDASQTEEFFVRAVDQYEGVFAADATVDVVAATEYSIWADVAWTYDGGVPNERNMYQLVRDGEDWKIAVLTPLEL